MTAIGETLPRARRSRWRWAMGIGLIVTGYWLVLTFLGGDPARQDLAASLAGPSWNDPLGKDQLGRSVISRLVHGAQYSLGIALLSMLIVSNLGTLLGLVAALSGRLMRGLIMRSCDVALAFPTLLAALLLASFAEGNAWGLLLAISLTGWTTFCRMSFTVARGQMDEAHIEAAKLAGFSAWHILRHHLLRPVLTQALPLAAVSLAGAIMAVSSLGFLGIGLRPPTPEWGAMLNELVPYLRQAPVQTLAPCVLIVGSMLVVMTLARRLEPSALSAWKVDASV